MGEQHYLLQLSQGWVEGWFLFIDVEPCAGDDSYFEGIGQRSFIATGPRAVLMRKAVGRIQANSRAPIR